MPAAPERRYAMTRVAAGDWVLPSNDGRTLYRIKSYEEDGSAQWRDSRGRERPVRGKWWGVLRYTGPTGGFIELDGDLWEWFDHGYPTRSAAVDAALRLGTTENSR